MMKRREQNINSNNDTYVVNDNLKDLQIQMLNYTKERQGILIDILKFNIKEEE